jgi:hypothetical protein
MLTDKGRKYMNQMIEMTRDQVDEPILACSPGFTSVGAMASMGVGMLSPLAGMVMRKSGKNKAEGLPHNVGLVVTPTKVHVFEMKPKRGKMAPKSLQQTWDRRAIQISTEDKAMSTRVTVDFPNEGRRLQIDATKGSAGMNEEVIRYLAEPNLNQQAV